VDFCFYRLDKIPRRHPHPLPVKIIASDPQKFDTVRHRFNTLNFSLILRGRGHYRSEEGSWVVRPPFVFTAFPGRRVEYGPHQDWEELFIVYDAKLRDRLAAAGFADEPAWRIASLGNISILINLLKDHLRNVDRQGEADRIDRVCESLLVECHLGRERVYTDEKERVIHNIQAYVEENYLEDHDFDKLARDYGLSPTTFRRYWGRLIGQPPARFVMDLRIQRAKRLLLESRMPIKSIASYLNFDDPLYFSRKFRDSVGLPATRYRKINRFSLSMTGRAGSAKDRASGGEHGEE